MIARIRSLALVPLLGLLLAPRPGAAQAPPGTHVYRPGVDVLHYDLSLHLPERGPAIEARAVLTLRRTAPVDTLVLDLVGLDVDSVGVDGRAVAFGRTPATVRVPLPPGAGDTLQVTVVYGGEPADGLIIRTDEQGRWTGFGDNWPNRARHWIPSVDHPSDKARVSWTVTAPSEREVIANGVRVATEPVPGPDGDTWTRSRWEEAHPIPTYLMVVGAGPLEEHSLGDTACGLREAPGCVPQAVYAFPEEEDFLPGPFDQADEIVEYFARLIAPFPYERLSHVQSSTRFGGMENATVIFYSDRAFREGTLDTRLIAHETAHHWYGNAVTEREWAHLWLSEGFATYLAELWREHAEGEAAFRHSMEEIRDRILASPVTGERPVIDTVQTDYLQLLNTNSYEKGAWVLHMLRSTVGDSAFFAGIREYYRENRHGTALTEDLQHAVERASGRELGWFFHQWLRRPGHVDASVTWRHDPEREALMLRIEQSGRFPPFRFPLTVQTTDASGTSHRTVVQVAAEPTQEIWIPIGSANPSEIVLDPDVELLGSLRLSGEL